VAAAGGNPTSNPRVEARFRGTARIASALVVVIGGVVCGGWILDIPTLQRLLPGLASMKLNTALGLGCLGLALGSSIQRPSGTPVTRVLALVAAAIAAATLVEYALRIDLGIDELLCRDPSTISAPGRMAPATAICVLGLGVAIAWLDRRWAEWLALVTAGFAHLTLLGYLYGVADLYAIWPFASVALHTAVSLYLLALGIVLARPGRGLMCVVTSDSPGGVLARRLLPAAVVVPAVLALLRQWGEAAGFYGTGAGRAMLVASSSAFFVALIWWTAAAIVRSDGRRRAARAELVRSYDRLRALASVSDTFATVATSYQALLDKIIRTIADLVGDGCLVTLLSEDGARLVNAANAHRDPALELAYRSYLSGLAVAKASSSSIAAAVMRTGVPRRADTLPGALVDQAEEVLKPIVARLNVHSFAVVPIRARKTIIGTLSLLRCRPGQGYTDDDLTLLQDLADRAGLAIENARLYDQLEQRVRARTKELESANRELEAFSYSVAHDLRAPLRSIAGFSRAVLEDHAEHLGPGGVQHMNRIEASARRMGELIDALLDLARVNRAELHRQPIQLSGMARAVMAQLQATQPGRDVEIVIEDGLVAEADPRLLNIALTNLLSNAWKFTGKRARARIELAARAGERPTTFVIRDNGAGFDGAHTGKLFGVFERLHTAAEFEGTGIGLAIVQRIIQRHGGRIWAEGNVDEGAAFFFTLEAGPDREAPG
jgi:signal transduction histidine kinase